MAAIVKCRDFGTIRGGLLLLDRGTRLRDSTTLAALRLTVRSPKGLQLHRPQRPLKRRRTSVIVYRSVIY